jgi:hypothetical protein
LRRREWTQFGHNDATKTDWFARRKPPPCPPEAEQYLRGKFGKASEEPLPLGMCTRCRELPADEQDTLATMAMRNACIDLITNALPCLPSPPSRKSRINHEG